MPAAASPSTVVNRDGSSNQIEASATAITARVARLLPCLTQKSARLSTRPVAARAMATTANRTAITATATATVRPSLIAVSGVAPISLMPNGCIPPGISMVCAAHGSGNMRGMKSVTRRVFLATASGAIVAGARTARASTQSASIQGANNRIRIGVIGTGGRARGLMTLLKRLPGNEMVAVCDVYEPLVLQAAEIAGTSPVKYAEYRRILDDREIDAVVIGAPDH